MDAVGNLVGNDQEIFNGIETNISKLLQIIGNANPDSQQVTQKIKELLTKLQDSGLSKLIPSSVFDSVQQLIDLCQGLMKNLIESCQNPHTYQLYNQILNDLNSILHYNQFNHFISTKNLNQALEQAIMSNNPNYISSDFAGFVSIFNVFDFSNDKNNTNFETSLFNDFIRTEFNGYGLKLGTQIANN